MSSLSVDGGGCGGGGGDGDDPIRAYYLNMFFLFLR
jgi:hypothetical protein